MTSETGEIDGLRAWFESEIPEDWPAPRAVDLRRADIVDRLASVAHGARMAHHEAEILAWSVEDAVSDPAVADDETVAALVDQAVPAVIGLENAADAATIRLLEAARDLHRRTRADYFAYVRQTAKDEDLILLGRAVLIEGEASLAGWYLTKGISPAVGALPDVGPSRAQGTTSHVYQWCWRRLNGDDDGFSGFFYKTRRDALDAMNDRIERGEVRPAPYDSATVRVAAATGGCERSER